MPEEGDRLGKWTVVRYIDRGGNGEVYEVEGPGGPAALKIINERRADSERYARFRREIETVGALGQRPGVLPILDSHLPEEPSRRDRGWYVMPLATPLAEHLEGQPVATAVGAIATLAETLAELHAQTIGHRDIKPQNLYWYNGAPALGDFGLVDIPDAQSLTEPGRVPGAFGYIADEVIMHPNDADSAPADVFALAKVLWKLLVPSAEYPPQGPLRADGGPATLARSLTVPRTDALDRILEAATANVGARIDMETMARELRAWLALPALAGLPAELNAAVLAARRSMTGTVNQREERAVRDRTGEALRAHLIQQSKDLFDSLSSVDPAGAQRGPLAVGRCREMIEQQNYLGATLWGEAFHHGLRITRGPTYDQEALLVAFCLQVNEAGQGAIGGLLLAGNEEIIGTPVHVLDARTAPVGVELEAAIDTIIEDAAQALPAMLDTFAKRGTQHTNG